MATHGRWVRREMHQQSYEFINSKNFFTALTFVRENTAKSVQEEFNPLLVVRSTDLQTAHD